MRRRKLLSLIALLPVPWLLARFCVPSGKRKKSRDLQAEAIELNRLAANIRSPEDARQLVTHIVEIFADILPPAWSTRSLCKRIAKAEFASATDPSRRIPETHLVTLWNRFAQEIAAPSEMQINVAELHNLRDAFFATAYVAWTRKYKNIWSVPAIYATEPDGSLAPGCRAVEALRLLWDLANIPDNLRSARERAQQSILISDLYREAAKHPPSQSVASVHHSVGARVNPVENAARQYVAKHGAGALTDVVVTMLKDLTSPYSA